MTLAERLRELVRAAFSGIYVHSYEHSDAIREIEIDEDTDRLLAELASEYKGDLGLALADLVRARGSTSRATLRIFGRACCWRAQPRKRLSPWQQPITRLQFCPRMLACPLTASARFL